MVRGEDKKTLRRLDMTKKKVENLDELQNTYNETRQKMFQLMNKLAKESDKSSDKWQIWFAGVRGLSDELIEWVNKESLDNIVDKSISDRTEAQARKRTAFDPQDICMKCGNYYRKKFSYDNLCDECKQKEK